MRRGLISGWVATSLWPRKCCSAAIWWMVKFDTPSVPDLARGHGVVQHARHFQRMGEDVGPVDLPQIDHIGAQAAQRGIDRRVQVGRALVIGQRRQDSALGGEHHPRAQAGFGRKHFAQQRFGIAETAGPVEAIDIRRVQQGDAGIERGMDQPGGVGRSAAILGQPPHAPCQWRDGKAAIAQRA